MVELEGHNNNNINGGMGMGKNGRDIPIETALCA